MVRDGRVSREGAETQRRNTRAIGQSKLLGRTRRRRLPREGETNNRVRGISLRQFEKERDKHPSTPKNRKKIDNATCTRGWFLGKSDSNWAISSRRRFRQAISAKELLIEEDKSIDRFRNTME